MDDCFWIHLLPWRQKNKAETKSAQVKFAAELAFTHENGWDYLQLQLVNRSSWTVWVEEGTIVLDDLYATFQTSVRVDQATIKIRQNVEARNTISLNVAAALYHAAGKPQGDYTCVVLVAVYYCVFDEWSTTQSDVCRVMMRGLTAVALRGARGYNNTRPMSQRVRTRIKL